jgi:hypothetical protein
MIPRQLRAAIRARTVYGTVDTGHAGGVHGNAAEHEDILTVVLPAKVFIERVRSGDLTSSPASRQGIPTALCMSDLTNSRFGGFLFH